MKRDRQIVFLGLPVFLVALLYLASCATPPPTNELAAAESATAEATATSAETATSEATPEATISAEPEATTTP